MERIIVEYEIACDSDVPTDIITSALISMPMKLVLVNPQGREREVVVRPVLAYPESVKA